MSNNARKVLAILFVMVCIVVCGPTGAFAEEFEVSDSTPYMVSDVIAAEGSSKTYQFTVDHSLYPNIYLYAYTSGSTPGNSSVYVRDENNKAYASVHLTTIARSAGTPVKPKGYSSFSNSTGETKTYIVRVNAASDNAGYTFIVTPEDNLAKYLGGREHAATVGSTIQQRGITNYITGYEILMNGEGDWYRYTPTSNVGTYIANRVEGIRPTAFEVYDTETGERIYQSDNEDQYTYTNLSVVATIMQERLELVVGREYLIHYYAPASISVSDPSTTYRIYVGLPSVRSETIKYTTPTSYTISANRKTTLRINVTGQSDLLRLGTNGSLSVNAGSNLNNAYITSCKITAPNGKTFIATNGRVPDLGIEPDLVDFLENTNNIPLNGLWTIEIQAEKTLNVKFTISGSAVALNRNTAP
ncbi:MAG: hypothetical protein HFF90_07870 [Oscillibacter sp.]|nr:hypothetical protein [Oscillibacter sp.]